MDRKVLWLPVGLAALAVVWILRCNAGRDATPGASAASESAATHKAGRASGVTTADGTSSERKSSGDISKATTSSVAPVGAQDKTPKREQVEEALFGRRMKLASLAPFAREALSEILQMLQNEKDEGRLVRLLTGYSYLASLQGLTETAGQVIILAKSGPLPVRIKAIEAAAKISDAKGVSLLIEVIGSEATSEDERILRQAGIANARFCQSGSVVKCLNRILYEDVSPDQVAAIEAIGTIAFEADARRLADLASNAASKEVKQEARLAFERIEILNDEKREEKLIAAVQSMRVSGDFRWYDWALDKIVVLSLTNLAGPLRALYDDRKAALANTGPDCYKLKLLQAISRLGGQVTSDEVELLRQAGRWRD